MHSGLIVVLPLAALLASAACNVASPTATRAATPPACETNNTAKVTFENRSVTNRTYSVVWDGSTLTTLAPSVQSSEYTVAAGIPHLLTFKVSNTGQLACTTSTPTPAQCSSHTYWCTY